MRCTYHTPKGVQCRRQCHTTAAYCHGHDPTFKAAHKKTGRRSRNKGSTFEREVANDLKPTFPHARRAGLRQTQSGAADAPDVDGCAPFWIETKHGKQPNPRAALKQASDALDKWASQGGNRFEHFQWPLAVCKDDRKPAFVVMRWEHFKELLTAWKTASTSQGSDENPT